MSDMDDVRYDLTPTSSEEAVTDWDSIRGLFTELYYHRDLPLSKVVDNEHFRDIKASSSTWKRRIEDWGLKDKRARKEAEMTAIIRKSRQHAAQGQQRRFIVRGRTYTAEDAFRYFRRKGRLRQYWDDYVFPECPTPEDVKSEAGFQDDDWSTSMPEDAVHNTPPVETASELHEIMNNSIETGIEYEDENGLGVEDENETNDGIEGSVTGGSNYHGFDALRSGIINENASDTTVFTPSSSPGSEWRTSSNSPTILVGDSVQGFVERLNEEESHEALMRQGARPPPTVFPSYFERAMRNFPQSIFAYYKQRVQSSDCVLATTKHDVDALYPSMKFGGLFFKYINLRSLGKYSEANGILALAFEMVDELLAVQDIRLLTYLLETVAYCRAAGRQDVAKEINKHFMTRSREILGRNHPITIFSTALQHPDQITENGFVERGLGLILAQFNEYLPPPNQVETMRLLLTGSTILKHQKDYISASQFLNKLHPMYENAYGEQSYQTVHCLTDQAIVLIWLKDFAEAKRLIVKALLATEATECFNDLTELAESRIRCEMALADLRGAQGNRAAQKERLEVAVELGVRMKLDDDHWMMTGARAGLAKLV